MIYTNFLELIEIVNFLDTKYVIRKICWHEFLKSFTSANRVKLINLHQYGVSKAQSVLNLLLLISTDCKHLVHQLVLMY